MVDAVSLTENEYWNPEVATALGQVFGFLDPTNQAQGGSLIDAIAAGDPDKAAEFNRVASAVQSGQMSRDQLLDYLVDYEIQQQQNDPDYGKLAEAPYETFTPFSKEAPSYTPLNQSAPTYSGVTGAPEFQAYGEAAPDFKRFSLADYMQDPGYQFRLEEGQNAIDKSNAAKGSFYSGEALKEAAQYASDLATQEYGAAYDRYNQDFQTESNQYDKAVDRYNNNYAIEAAEFSDKYNRNLNDYATKSAEYGSAYDRNLNDFNTNYGQYADNYNRHNNNFSMGYNQAKTDSDTLYNRLAGIIGTGSGSTNTAVNANTQNASSLGNIYGQVGNAQAGAALNQGSIWGNVLENTFNNLPTIPKVYGT